MGYHRAGFDEIVGVDIKPQPRYPFPFVQTDALWYLARHGHEFDAIHASPPCQSYSRALKHLATPQPMLIDDVREMLQQIAPVWVIENVEGAPMPTASTLFGAHGALVCGTTLGLDVYRHRIFEANVPLVGTLCDHRAHAMNPHNQRGRDRIARQHDGNPEVVWAKAMGVEWMNRHEAREAVPPAFTEFIGRQLLSSFGERA